MTDKTPARRIVVKLSAREKDDPLAQLLAVREACRASGMTLHVVNANDAELTPSPAKATVKDEQLETASRNLAMNILNAKAAEAAEQAARSELKSQRVAAEILAMRQGLKQWAGFLLLRGISITVEAYDRLATTGSTVIKSVAKMFYGGGGNESESK